MSDARVGTVPPGSLGKDFRTIRGNDQKSTSSRAVVSTTRCSRHPGVSAFVGLCVGVALLEATRVVSDRSIARASEELRAARATTYLLIETRLTDLSLTARVVATLPAIAGLVHGPLDIETNGSHAVEAYRQSLQAEGAFGLKGRHRAKRSH
jgi:hypothetical protein